MMCGILVNGFSYWNLSRTGNGIMKETEKPIAEIGMGSQQERVFAAPSSAERDGSTPSAMQDAFVGHDVKRLPNVTLPCPSGVLVDMEAFVPRTVSFESLAVDYLFGRAEIEGMQMRFFPTDPGEQEIGLAYLHDGKRCTVTLKMLVNEDPKKLWVRNDPPSASPFMKALYVSESNEGRTIRFLAASRRGRAHEQNGTFRDDDFGFWVSPNDDVHLVVVADGAGSARYSREGSRRAVRYVLDYLTPRIAGDVWCDEAHEESKNGKVSQLLCGAAYHALNGLRGFCQEENLKLEAADRYALGDFNTTLLVAAVRDFSDGVRKIVSFSIGDGAIAWVERGRSELLCSPDGGEYSGQTRFLTTVAVWPKAEDEWTSFRENRVFTKTIDADSVKRGFVAVMTDGVSDPFFETDARLHDAAAWDEFLLGAADVDDGEKVLKNILSCPDADTASKQLLSWLGFWSCGNHDDRTIAVLAPCGGRVFD